MKIKLMEMTLKEVREQGPFEVAVLAWGSCEPHGLHLPFGCDTFIVERFVEASCRKAQEKGARVIMLPVMPLGTNSNLFRFPMTLHWSPTTQLAILKDLIRSLEAHNVYKLVIVNGHGGNEFRALLRELYGLTKVHVFLMDNWYSCLNMVCEDKGGEHANEGETASLMHLYPELVHLEWADAGSVREPRLNAMKKGALWTVRPWHLLTHHSGYGNPRKATADKGRIAFEHGNARIAEVLVELAAAPLDDSFPYILMTQITNRQEECSECCNETL